VTAQSHASSTKDTLQRLADWMAHPHTSTADLAAIRRMNPSDPSGAAVVLYRLLGSLGINGPQARPWALIVHCLALARGKHRTGGPGVGKALVEIGYGEARLQMLLRADFETLADVLPRLARRLHSRNQLMDWWPLAHLVLGSATDPERAQRAREQIARDYVIASRSD